MKLEPLHDALVMWTIYENPKDFPGEFVARAHVVAKGGKSYVGLTVLRAKTLQDVREQVFKASKTALVRMPRTDGDPKQIVETWV